jgi:antitoxin (DNA-binding transcriptional repressor) of toxin-antitoxin stability system
VNSIKASDFKARCLRILDDVQRTGETVAISKRGRVVAELVPSRFRGHVRYPQHALRGTGRTLGDIVSPAVPREAWDTVRGRGT